MTEKFSHFNLFKKINLSWSTIYYYGATAGKYNQTVSRLMRVFINHKEMKLETWNIVSENHLAHTI